VAKKKPNRALRRFHARGKRVLRVAQQRKRVWGTAAILGAKTSSQQHRLMEARRFAQLYSAPDLEVLCRLGQDNGRPITRLQVLQLIRVSDRRKRNALARKCAKNAWSVRRLQLEIDRLIPRRSFGGRSQAPPKSVEEALLVTAHMVGSLVRWVSVLSFAKRPARDRVTVKQLPGSIRAKLRAVCQDADELWASIERQLKKRSAKQRQNARRKKPHP
jgi:hypothetical protein